MGCITPPYIAIVLTICTEVGAMASPCKRMRLSADDDSDSDDQVIVTAVKTNDDNVLSNKVEVLTDKTVTTAAGDDVHVNMSCLKPSTIDLSTDPPPGDTRRSFSHTAEVIKARYNP